MGAVRDQEKVGHIRGKYTGKRKSSGVFDSGGGVDVVWVKRGRRAGGNGGRLAADRQANLPSGQAQERCVSLCWHPGPGAPTCA